MRVVFRSLVTWPGNWAPLPLCCISTSKHNLACMFLQHSSTIYHDLPCRRVFSIHVAEILLQCISYNFICFGTLHVVWHLENELDFVALIFPKLLHYIFPYVTLKVSTTCTNLFKQKQGIENFQPVLELNKVQACNDKYILCVKHKHQCFFDRDWIFSVAWRISYMYLYNNPFHIEGSKLLAITIVSVIHGRMYPFLGNKLYNHRNLRLVGKSQWSSTAVEIQHDDVYGSSWVYSLYTVYHGISLFFISCKMVEIFPWWSRRKSVSFYQKCWLFMRFLGCICISDFWCPVDSEISHVYL